MENKRCSKCNERLNKLFSASYHTGMCLSCRKKLIPIHIPLEQHARFVSRINSRLMEVQHDK